MGLVVAFIVTRKLKVSLMRRNTIKMCSDLMWQTRMAEVEQEESKMGHSFRMDYSGAMGQKEGGWEETLAPTKAMSTH